MSTTTITLTYSSLYDVVERSLAIIGKRATDNNGKLLFKDITLGTNEKSIVNDYFREAALDIATAISTVITATGGTDNVSFTITINLSNSNMSSAVQKAAEDYCVSHALYSWFTVTAPAIAKRYLDERSRRMGTVISLVYNRPQPNN